MDLGGSGLDIDWPGNIFIWASLCSERIRCAVYRIVFVSSCGVVMYCMLVCFCNVLVFSYDSVLGF